MRDKITTESTETLRVNFNTKKEKAMVLQAVGAQRGSFCDYIANHPHDAASFTVLTTGVLNASICLKQGNHGYALGFLIAGATGALILHLDKIVQVAHRNLRP